jgi:hypothetical protein
MKIEIPCQIFEKYSPIKFNKNPSIGSRVEPRRRTDAHDEANGRFSQFCEGAYKNQTINKTYSWRDDLPIRVTF